MKNAITIQCAADGEIMTSFPRMFTHYAQDYELGVDSPGTLELAANAVEWYVVNHGLIARYSKPTADGYVPSAKMWCYAGDFMRLFLLNRAALACEVTIPFDTIEQFMADEWLVFGEAIMKGRTLGDDDDLVA